MEGKINLNDYFLKSTSLYDMLSQDELSYLKVHEVYREYKKGQILFREGSFPKGIYIIRKGKVKIYSTNAKGTESIIYFYQKNEFFGHRPLLSNEAFSFSAMAFENLEVSFIPGNIFVELVHSSASLSRSLLTSMFSEFNVWLHKIIMFSQFSVRERVALSLLLLGKLFERDKKPGTSVVIVINRTDLAGYVGTAKETIVRTLRTFKDEKIISSRGSKIKLLKPEALYSYLENQVPSY